MRGKLSVENPVLLKEWDRKKNMGLNPDDFTAGSNKKVWWKCKLNHSWFAQIVKRFIFGRKCPYCSGNKVWLGYNDIPTTHPDLAGQWDYEKNGALRPEQFSAGADIKIWWRCGEGHSWEARIYSRKKHGCPVCARNILAVGVNDLLTINPRVADEWDYEKNYPLRPEGVAANNNGKAWWCCEYGHSWEAAVCSRNAGRGCPYCGSRTVLPGFNDLATLNPTLANDWDYTKNLDLTPQDVMLYSHKHVWWKCKNGQSWRSKVSNRANGTECPYCANRLASIGETDLATLRPDLVAQWDMDKNNLLTPTQVTIGSNRRVWWRCEHGHSWETTVVARTHGRNCPYCNHKRPIVGETDFETVHPELLKEWDSERNGNKKPENFTYGSQKAVWWKCDMGHRWKISICNRHGGHNCPVCAKLKDKHIVVPGQNDLASRFPHIAEQWDYENNENLTPWQVMPGSNKKVWWTCNRGHNWLASVLARTYGTQCPYCNRKYPMRTRFIT